MNMSEIVQDYLEAEGIHFTREEYREKWGQNVIRYDVPLSKSLMVMIYTGNHPSEIRIVTTTPVRKIPESFINVTNANPALVQSIVRAAIYQRG